MKKNYHYRCYNVMKWDGFISISSKNYKSYEKKLINKVVANKRIYNFFIDTCFYITSGFYLFQTILLFQEISTKLTFSSYFDLTAVKSQVFIEKISPLYSYWLKNRWAFFTYTLPWQGFEKTQKDLTKWFVSL